MSSKDKSIPWDSPANIIKLKLIRINSRNTLLALKGLSHELDWAFNGINRSVKAGFRIQIRIQIRINLSCWIRIQIQEGKNDPQK